jgi:phage terminase large subunit
VAELVLDYEPRMWAEKHLHGPEDAPNLKRGGVFVLHRRCGKTVGELNKHIRHAIDHDLEAQRLRFLQPDFTDRDIQDLLVARNYAHILPELKQAKAVAWEPLKTAAQAIPGYDKNESELTVSFPGYRKPSVTIGPKSPLAPAKLPAPRNIIRLWGGDNADALRGIKLSGAAYDEYQDHNPYLHNAIVGKSLADHLGYHDRLGTVKGKNQLYQAWKAAAKEPATWTALWQDVDTSLATETGAVILALKQALADDRQQVAMGLMTQTLFDQEWYLSVEAAIEGAIYGREMSMVRQQGRILRSVYDPALSVDTYWDLGIADHMTIWGVQTTRSGEIRVLFAYGNLGFGFPHYINYLHDLREKRGYVYGKHHAPHDIEVRELTTGQSRRESAKKLGITFETGKQVSLEDGINAVRLVLPRCYFADEDTELGREALMQYRWHKNKTTNEFTSEPVHDWTSHYADAFREMANKFRVVEKAPSAPRAYGPSSSRATWMGA